MNSPSKERIVVAMSGGVDSSVAAVLLKEQGYDVIGISMRLWTYDREATHGCCTPEDLDDARKVAQIHGFPHYIVDLEKDFEKTVVDNFLKSYRMGETPNPCARCNQDVKFSILLKKAKELGAKYLATGHYARRVEENGKIRLYRGKDHGKDQSYFLFALTQEELASVTFPLGELPKSEVRKMAEAYGLLSLAQKPDSQEICFIQGSYADFVEQRLGKEALIKGKMTDESGDILGEHDGIHQFTVGQRKGLGLQSLEPKYVLAVHPDGRVVTGPNESLFKRVFEVREMTWVAEPLEQKASVLAQIRSRFSPKPAEIEILGDGRVKVIFQEPQRAITPGQAAVFFQGEEVLGGGWIDSVQDQS